MAHIRSADRANGLITRTCYLYTRVTYSVKGGGQLLVP